MANQKTLLDQWSVKDLEDNTALNIVVEQCTELGNGGLPGIQIVAMGQFVTFEPDIVERWAYQARKQGVAEYYIEDKSWSRSEEEYVRYFLVTTDPLSARIVVKTRTSKPITRDYGLPFSI